MEVFVFLADGVLGVDFGDVVVGGGEGFFEFGFFGLFVFGGFGGLSIELFGCELRGRTLAGRDNGEGEDGWSGL